MEQDIFTQLFNDIAECIRQTAEEIDNGISRAFRKDDGNSMSDIERTVMCLIDVNQDNTTIVNLLQKYWNLDEQTAVEILRRTKTVLKPLLNLSSYLRREKLMTDEEIRRFMDDHSAEKFLFENSDSENLSAEQLYQNLLNAN